MNLYANHNLSLTPSIQSTEEDSTHVVKRHTHAQKTSNKYHNLCREATNGWKDKVVWVTNRQRTWKALQVEKFPLRGSPTTLRVCYSCNQPSRSSRYPWTKQKTTPPKLLGAGRLMRAYLSCPRIVEYSRWSGILYLLCIHVISVYSHSSN